MGFFKFKTVFYAIFLGFWFSTSLFAQENALSLPSKEYDLQMTKGTALLNQKKYPEAEAAFQAALAARPHDPKATYSLGVAAGKEGKYPEAERNLLESLRLDPQQTEVYLDLGVVYFQQKKFENALDILSRGENIDPEDPKILFYQGRIYQESREDDQAAPRFLRAAALANEDDPGLAAAAQYQAGVSFLRQRIFDEAKDAFTEVIRRSPHSEMGKSAQAFLIQIDQGGKEGEKWDLSVSVSDQYDDNVVLEPSDSAFAVSDKSDSRAVFYLNGNYYFRKPPPWGGGIGYSFYQSLHRELDSFNTQSHEPDLFLTYEKDRIQARVDYLFSFITVDQERYLQSHTIRPTATLAHGSGRLTRLFYQIQFKNFEESAQFPVNSERDAVNHAAGAMELFRFARGKGTLRAGYTLDLENARGADWDYQGHRLLAGAGFLFPAKIRGELEADYARRRYDAPNAFSAATPKEKRDDVIYTANLALSRPFSKTIGFSLQYTYTWNDSNLSLFDYKRNVYSASLTGRF